MIHWRYNLLITLLYLSISVYGNNRALIEIINESDSEFRWNPHRQRGLIIKDNLTISFMPESSYIVINNNSIVSGLNFKLIDDVVYINNESAKVLYRLLKIQQEQSEEIIDDEDLFNIPVIILDPGHGGRDPGAIGKHEDFTIYEKEVVLDICHRVSDLLIDNYSHKKIIMTRSDDKFLTLEERVDIANEIELEKKEAIIYISIHANASLNKKAQGFEVWYLPEDYRRNVLGGEFEDNDKLKTIVNAIKEDELSLEGKTLAGAILDGMANEIESQSPNRGLKEEIWFVVRKARMASVLIEVGFVTNSVEGERLTDDEYLQKVSKGIYEGIANFVESYENSGR